MHFPLRSFEQFRNKIEKGGAAYERNTTLPPTMGDAWRSLYRLHLDGGLRDHYADRMRSDDDVRQALRDDEVYIDTRVRDRLRILAGSPYAQPSVETPLLELVAGSGTGGASPLASSIQAGSPSWNDS